MNITLQFVIAVAALSGFFLAWHIRHEKKRHRDFTCPLNFDCRTVVKSRHSTFLGIPVELWGMAYYLAVFLYYAAVLVFPYALSEAVSAAVLVATIFAFLFSLYLTGIQAFVLRQWCSWCLMSAGLCTVIFLSALYVSGIF